MRAVSSRRASGARRRPATSPTPPGHRTTARSPSPASPRREDGATTGRLEVVDVESGERRVVWTPPAKTLPNYPRWSPDGASLVFEQTRYPSAVPESGTDLGSAIAILDVGDAAEAPATPRVITRWESRATYPDWSPDGETIVFTTYDLGEFQGTDEPSNLFTIRPDGTDLTQLTRYPPGGKRATQPTWTPDGTRILFTLVGQSPGVRQPPPGSVRRRRRLEPRRHPRRRHAPAAEAGLVRGAGRMGSG